MTLISDSGCPGLTDRLLHGKMRIYLRCLRLTDNQLSGSCKLWRALSGSDGQNGSIAARPRISGAVEFYIMEDISHKISAIAWDNVTL